jgi:chloride channel protein, CIC family
MSQRTSRLDHPFVLPRFSGLSDVSLMLVASLLVGGLAGLGIVLFHETVLEGTRLLGGLGKLLGSGQRVYLLLLPAAGGLLVGLWTLLLKPRGPGQGVAGIMEAVTYHGGRIDLRSALGRVAGAVVTLSSGGSAGPEDPSVQLGSTVGAQLGRVLRLSEQRVQTLVACGAAAAVAAAFKAPISGVFFAVEIILGEFSGYSITFVVLAAVAGATVSQTFLGNSPSFAVPAYELRHPAELLTYVLLGGVAACVGVVYVRLLNATEELSERWRFPNWLKPALGGLIVGGIAFAGRPEVMGVGYETLGSALSGAAPVIWLCFALTALKILATTATVGSGGQGGLFAPALFIGAMLGLGVGALANAVFPAISAPAAAYGLVAMGALLASAVRAPILAIMLPFEMTNDYRIILPLMLAVVTSYLVSRRLEPESVYTLKLRARGVDLAARRNTDLMRAITVGEAMTRDFPTVSTVLPLGELGDLFQRTGHHGFPVLDAQGNLAGVVTLQDYERSLTASPAPATVADIYTGDPITAFPEETLQEVLTRFGESEVGRVPVVDLGDTRKLLGVLRRSDITGAYSRALARRDQAQCQAFLSRARADSSLELIQVEVPRGATCVGKAVQDLALPPDCILVSLQRGRRRTVPHGQTTLQAGDTVAALAAPACRFELEGVLTALTAGTV